MQKVSIIIPNYNGELLLAKHMPSVKNAYDNPDNNILEVIVVDDCSIDKSVLLIKKHFPFVKLIKHQKNRGFSATVNTGARSAKAPLLVLLNTDVSPSRSFLQNVLKHFDDQSVFAVSLHEKGYGPATGFFRSGFIEHGSGKESKKVKDSFWASGGSAAFRRSMWMELGGMDESLYSPFYWEDVDMGYRAHKRGWKVIWEPNAKVLHEHEGTMQAIPKTYKSRIQERNQLLLIWKNITSNRLIRKHISGLIERILQHPGYLRIVLMAIAKMPIVIKARRREVKEEKVSDEAIFTRFKNV